ncbi:MAG: hypothetical protein EOO81_07165 [Oxalobacteraceae bacterium]|nr:MAG: hypothetical protein EOO81_07165 [Oxalobacteraceae bacterium]
MKPKLSCLRFGVWLVISLASLAMAWANALGYVWSGVWLRPWAIATAAAYLPLFFAVAWLLIAATKPLLVNFLLATSVMALALCTLASLYPEQYPLKVTLTDFAVIVLLPLGGYWYRRLLKSDRRDGLG